jgi:hypothetical protein
MSTSSWWRWRARVGAARCCRSQDRGYASSLWLGALSHFAARFVLRWRHDYRLVCGDKLKAAWKIAQGKKAWGSRGLWHARRRTWVSASVLAFALRHPDHPAVPLWLVVAGGTGGRPCYLLTSEPLASAAQAWSVVLAYARRWQIALACKTCKSELGMQSPLTYPPRFSRRAVQSASPRSCLHAAAEAAAHSCCRCAPAGWAVLALAHRATAVLVEKTSSNGFSR